MLFRKEYTESFELYKEMISHDKKDEKMIQLYNFNKSQIKSKFLSKKKDLRPFLSEDLEFYPCQFLTVCQIRRGIVLVEYLLHLQNSNLELSPFLFPFSI